MVRTGVRDIKRVGKDTITGGRDIGRGWYRYKNGRLRYKKGW